MEGSRDRIAFYRCNDGGSMRLPWRQDRQRGGIASRADDGCSAAPLPASGGSFESERSGAELQHRGTAQRCSDDVAAVGSSCSALGGVGGDLASQPSWCRRVGRSSSPGQGGPARRRSGSTSDRAMRRRCRGGRTPTWMVRGVATTKTAPGRRIGRRRPSKCCCCDDGATCPSISNSIRIFSPATGRSWRFLNASLVFSTSTTKPLISWRTVRILISPRFSGGCWIQSIARFFYIHIYMYIFGCQCASSLLHLVWSILETSAIDCWIITKENNFMILHLAFISCGDCDRNLGFCGITDTIYLIFGKLRCLIYFAGRANTSVKMCIYRKNIYTCWSIFILFV